MKTAVSILFGLAIMSAPAVSLADDTKVVPISIHRVGGSPSNRAIDGILREVNRIWAQGQKVIQFEVLDVDEQGFGQSIEKTKKEIERDIFRGNSPKRPLSPFALDVWVVNGAIGRPSVGVGLAPRPAFQAFRGVLLEQVDGRHLAHELGHNLSLPQDTSNGKKLMFETAGGEELDKREIQNAYTHADNILQFLEEPIGIRDFGGSASAGTVRMFGEFTAPEALNLRTAKVRITSLLNEVGGAGELVDGLPLSLNAKAGNTENEAVFETQTGTSPGAILTIRRKEHVFEFTLDVEGASIQPAAACANGKPTAALTTIFIIRDAVTRSANVEPSVAVRTPRQRNSTRSDIEWQCRKDVLKTDKIPEPAPEAPEPPPGPPAPAPPPPAPPGPQGKLDVQVRQVTFNDTAVGRSSELSVTIRNTGEGNLRGAVFAPKAPFTIAGGGGNFILRPGKDRPVRLSFGPELRHPCVSQPAGCTGTLQIKSDQPKETVAVALVGKPLVGSLLVTPEALRLLPGEKEEIIDLEADRPKSIEVKNNGQIGLEVTVRLEPPFSDLGLVQVRSGEEVLVGEAIFTLDPGEGQRVTLKYSPTGAGSKRTTLTISGKEPRAQSKALEDITFKIRGRTGGIR